MAEFIEIIKIKNRMCQTVSCIDCPLTSENNGCNLSCGVFEERHPEEFERICLEWSEKNPEITNADKLIQVIKEVFGEEIVSKVKESTFGVYGCSYLACPETNGDCCNCENYGFWKKAYVEPKEGE